MSSTNDANSKEVIARGAEKITAQAVDQFRYAVNAKATGFPPTYATLYRHTEFEWLARLGLKLENVLHTEQEYEYLDSLSYGDEPHIETTVASHRERRGMHFLTLESKVICQGTPKVLARSSFVIREEAAK